MHCAFESTAKISINKVLISEYVVVSDVGVSVQVLSCPLSIHGGQLDAPYEAAGTQYETQPACKEMQFYPLSRLLQFEC